MPQKSAWVPRPWCTGADRAWWSDWSSKPAGVRMDLGRFDSYTLPPRPVHFCVALLRHGCAEPTPVPLAITATIHCIPWHYPCDENGRLAGSEPCTRLRSVMRNGDRIVGSRPLPAAPPNLRLYPSTSRTFCASAAAVVGDVSRRENSRQPVSWARLQPVEQPACGLFSSSSRR